MHFETLQQLDEHFQQQYGVLQHQYEAQTKQLEKNKQYLITKLNNLYKQSHEQLKSTYRMDKLMLEKNSEQAVQQIQKVYLNKIQKYKEIHQKEKTLFEEIIVEKTTTLIEQKIIAEKKVYHTFEQAQLAGVAKIKELTQLQEYQQEISVLRMQIYDKLELVSEQYEACISDIKDTLQLQFDDMLEKFEEQIYKLKTNEEATLQKLSYELIEQTYKLDQQFLEDEANGYDQYLLKEQLVHEQFENQQQLIYEQFLQDEAAWEHAYQRAYENYKLEHS